MSYQKGRPPRAFCHEIAVVLAVKVVALFAIYFVFFASRPQLPDAAGYLFEARSTK